MERPIVATNVGGIPELVRDGLEGFLVPVSAPHKIAEKALFYLNHRDVGAELGRRARARAVERFDITHCVARHESCYRLLASSEAGDRP